LAQVWQLPLTALNCRDVVLRGADLHSDRWQGVDVRGADLGQTHLHHPLGRSPVCALSGSGHTIAVGDQDGHLLAWQTTGVPLGTGLHLEAPSAVTAIALNPPGDTLVEGRQDGRVHLWALPHPYGPDPLPSASEVAITALIFGPGDQWIAGGDEDGHLLLWQVASGTCRYRQSGHSTGIVAIAASPCGQFLLSADRAGNVVEWQVSTGRVRDRFNGRVNSHLGSIGYLPQGTGTGARAIALGTDEGRITIWDIASGTPWRILPGQCDLPLASCISPNGQHAAMADLRGQVYLWDLEQCRPLAAAQAASPVTDLAFSPEGAHLLWASDYQVQLHQPLRGDRRQTWSSQYPLAIALATTATPQPHLLSLHPDGTLRGWRSRSSGHWHLEHRLTLPQGATGRHLLIGPQNHHWLVITTTAIYRWQTDTQTWQPVPLPLGRAPLTAYALDARETWLALGDDQGTVTLWHLPSGRRHHTFTAHDRAISAIAFSPNGDQLACGSYDHHLSGWTIDGQPLWRLAGHQRHIHTLSYGTDHTLVSGSWDGTIRHWDLRRTVETHCWDVAQPLIYGVTLDPAGHALALVGTEHTLEVWESQSQTCRHRMTVAAALWQVAPSPDGQLLLGASQGGDITLWDLTTGDRRGQLRVDRPYEGLNIQGCRGLTPTEREHLYALGAVEYDSAPPPMSPMSSA
jgi:WD40 repeat protein